LGDDAELRGISVRGNQGKRSETALSTDIRVRPDGASQPECIDLIWVGHKGHGNTTGTSNHGNILSTITTACT